MYNCTGNPHPADVEKIVDTMMNAEFTTAHKRELALFPLATLRRAYTSHIYLLQTSRSSRCRKGWR